MGKPRFFWAASRPMGRSFYKTGGNLQTKRRLILITLLHVNFQSPIFFYPPPLSRTGDSAGFFGRTKVNQISETLDQF